MNMLVAWSNGYDISFTNIDVYFVSASEMVLSSILSATTLVHLSSGLMFCHFVLNCQSKRMMMQLRQKTYVTVL